jgi:hypothetical protein
MSEQPSQRRGRARRAAALVLSVAAAVTTASCDHHDQDNTGPMKSVLHLDFDGARISQDDRVIVTNKGQLPVDVHLATAGGGTAEIAPRSDGGDALRLPKLSNAASPPRAVLLVTPAAGHDDLGGLGPGNRDFRYGAAFVLDPRSEGVSLDNGNNVVQRGLIGDPSQYKFQVDHGHASCRVAGDQGVVEVLSRSVIRPGDWYTATCSRVGRKVTLTLRDEQGATEHASATGSTGSVTVPADTPLTVGGKAYDEHAVTGNSDQFNGEIGEVFLDVRQPGTG